jgi:hypothetical protein
MMGIRVNKMIGYGLTNLSYETIGEYKTVQMTDPRIDWNVLNDEDAIDWKAKSFIKWMKKNKTLLKEQYDKEYFGVVPNIDVEIQMLELAMKNRVTAFKKEHMYHCIVHEPEFGLPNVMMFIAPDQFKHWHRHDDSIDYEEEGKFHESKPRVERLSGGIFPYLGNIIRIRKPKEPLDEFYIEKHARAGTTDTFGPLSIGPGDYAFLVGTWDRKQKPKATGYALEHFKNDFRPHVPLSIIALILWSGAYPNPQAIIDDLRPYLYVYWR